ncbi:MAG: nicotinate (nicotinamide) nucleotide adenylyltransferase [Bacteroidales bacterium]|nr:nicotinate (nicotinamide) nucleotide adenylyltransferase [Bacteroidales bacterium]
MKVAVYSGSFNPLHIGHQAILEYLTGEGLFDHVYLIVSPQNPFKDAANALTGRERFEAAVAAVARHHELDVTVDDIELTMDPPNYTIRTLDALKEREPENEFTLVIGGDNLDCLMRWRDPERILLEYGVAVYPRTGFDIEAIKEDLLRQNPDYRIMVLDAPIVDISSTQIREGLAMGKDMSAVMM